MDSETIVEAIDRQEWLNPVGDALGGAVRGAFKAGGTAGAKTKDFLHGTWLGHPLHVVLTDVPIGAWTASTALDLTEMATGRTELAPGADAALGVGLVGALGSAAAGLTDWSATSGKRKRVGLTHGLLNIAATGLMGASWVLRKRGQRGAAQACSLAGFGLACASSFLGGVLVYDEKMGVDNSDRETLPDGFVSVLPLAKLPENTPTRANAKGTPVVLVRQGERIYALDATCAHLGGPLNEGTLDGTVIQCPWHGSRFSLEDGSVVDGPAVHPQPCFETRVRNGRIEVRAVNAVKHVIRDRSSDGKGQTPALNAGSQAAEQAA